MTSLARAVVFLVLLSTAAVSSVRAGAARFNEGDMLLVTRNIDGQNDIFMAQPDGLAVNLTHTSESENEPVWSPDGEFYAYIYSDMDDTQIHLRHTFSSQSRVLTDSTDNKLHLSWSPDGHSLIFSQGLFAISGSLDLTKLELVTGSLKSITDDNTSDTSAVVSPNGDALAHVRDNNRHRIIALPGGNVLFEVPHYVRDPAWDPTGRYLAYVGPRDRFVRTVIDTLYVYDLSQGDTPRRYPQDVVNMGLPAWSPDGQYVAFAAEPIEFDTRRIQRRQLFVMAMDTGAMQQLSHGSHRVLSVAWAPDGDTIMYTSWTSDGDYRLCFYGVDSGKNHCPPGLDGTWEPPVWRPR